LGKNIEIQGTYVTKIKKTKSTPRNGRAAFTTDIIGMPATPEVTKIFLAVITEQLIIILILRLITYWRTS
tara:strand:- start:86 stop:295 length:210 start_codon:yes stop_codon:yes gene_type:complete